MKHCKTAPPACLWPSKPCCEDCPDKTCQNRCWNSPKRCGCWTEGPPPRKRGKGGGRYLDWDEIVRLRGQGLMIAQIAERMDCSIQAVSDALKKRGVDERAQS